MDFRLPQPLKYSLKKKKGRRKVLRKETGKLSLKNHNRNASCQTDSSESSELSSASSSKKNRRHSKTGQSSQRTAINNDECFPCSIKHQQNPVISASSVYHYCTPSRRKEKESYRLHRPPTIESIYNSSGQRIGAKDPCYLAVEEEEMVKDGASSLLKHSKEEEGAHSSILISDSDSDSISVGGDICRNESDRNGRNTPDCQSTPSDTSKILLESSLLTSEHHSPLFISSDSPREKLKNGVRFDTRNDKKDASIFRSSALYKKFNKAVENDLAVACNSSDFYMRVKNRVLGLKQNNSKMYDQKKICHSEEKTYSPSGREFCQIYELAEEDKENVDVNTIEREQLPSFYEIVKRRTTIVPDSEGSSIDTCSPSNHIVLNKSEKFNHSRVSENADQKNKHESILVSESSISTIKDSDLKSITQVSCKENSSTGSCMERGQKTKKKCVILDSDDSSECESPKRKPVYVIESSDSESLFIEPESDPCNMGEIHGSGGDKGGEIPHSEARNNSRKTLFLDNADHKSGSSDLFRRVTKRVLILDSSDSIDKSGRAQERSCDILKEIEMNLQFKPGFSTLSQSKHEDIKKWLNAIPSHPEIDGINISSVKDQNKSGSDSKGRENDNISLTEMEKVLNELYGKDWGIKKKTMPKLVPKKKESQIICERLTDSDDSSTPPLPASTPGKKKLYNHNKNLVTPQDNCYATPIQGKNIFTPLTSVGKKGGNNTHKTPRTAGPKSRREKACLNSGAFSSPILTFIASLSVGHQSARCHPEAKYFVKNFKSKKNDLVQKLFEIFNKDVFSSKLPHDMPIIWNNRLRKTAGYCYNRRVKNSEGGFTRTSRVELSSKIVDNAARLRDTLIHELCHAATWIISEVTGGHGPSWKRWTNKAMAAFPELPPISRCHNYDIVTKYKYQCTSCNYSIGRHSKSLDIQRKCCGICGGTFELFLNAKDEAGKSVPKTPRTLNAFALFVKENYKTMKNTQDNLKHKDVMRLLSDQFAAAKISSVQREK